MVMIKSGDSITLEYTGKFKNGLVFDTTKEKGPLSIIMGEGKIIKPLEEALMGMKEGDEKTVNVSAKEGYGKIKDKLQISVPLDKLKIVPKIGNIVTLESKEGVKQKGIVISVDKEKARLDFNHPLAGKDLIFDLKVISIK